MILGNVYRERGQVARAIQVHQALLQRPKLTRLEHAYVLLCLGLDFKRGGFVDRALEAFKEVLRLRSGEPVRAALPAEAARRAAPMGRGVPHPPAAGRAERAGHARRATRRSSAFLENELGMRSAEGGDRAGRGAPLRVGDRPRSDRRRRPTSISATCALQRAIAAARRGRLGAADRRARPIAPIWRSIGCERALRQRRHAADVRGAMPAAHRRAIRRTGARGWRWAASRRARADPNGVRAAARGARAQSARPHRAPGALERAAASSISNRALVQRYIESRAIAGVLPRSARLHQVPLPQHRAALAVPALPRMEHVRRRSASRRPSKPPSSSDRALNYAPRSLPRSRSR